MFVIIATKPLNDGTKGFRFNFFGKKGLMRKRQSQSRGWFKRQRMQTSVAYHFGRLTVYFFKTLNTARKLGHFVG